MKLRRACSETRIQNGKPRGIILNDKIEIIGYKAFDNDLKCRGFQYEIGKSYKQDGDIQVCENGFHFCENPLDVLSYYDLTTSRFAVVSGSSNSSKCDDDSKIATAEITIKAELKLPDFIKKSVDYLLSACGKETAASGDCSQLAASGDDSVVMSCGLRSKAKAGKDGAIALTYKDEHGRFRIAVGYIGEGLKAGTFYKVNSSGEFLELSK